MSVHRHCKSSVSSLGLGRMRRNRWRTFDGQAHVAEWLANVRRTDTSFGNIIVSWRADTQWEGGHNQKLGGRSFPPKSQYTISLTKPTISPQPWPPPPPPYEGLLRQLRPWYYTCREVFPPYIDICPQHIFNAAGSFWVIINRCCSVPRADNGNRRNNKPVGEGIDGNTCEATTVRGRLLSICKNISG